MFDNAVTEHRVIVVKIEISTVAASCKKVVSNDLFD
jgi:hypothetical protein